MKSETTVDPALAQCLDDLHIAQHMPGDVRRTATLSNIGVSAHHADDIAPSYVASHPGLLALARVLGRNAARADMRRARRGVVAVMGVTDSLLVIAALIAITLVWSVILRLR